MWWPLMQSAITESDKQALINFISTSDRYTCGPKVKEFEDAWSKWLGCKHSLFVTSGSGANFLLLASIKENIKSQMDQKFLYPHVHG